MSTAIQSKNGRPTSAEAVVNNSYTSADVVSTIQLFVLQNGAQSSLEKFEHDCLRSHPELQEFSQKKPEKWKHILESARTKTLEKTVKILQSAYLQEARSLLSLKQLNSKDAAGFEESVSDSTLNKFYPTIEEKIAYLKQSITKYLPKTESDIHANTAKFYGMLSSAKEAGYLGTKKVQEWKDRLESSRWNWYQKQVFVQETFPTFISKWQKTASLRAKTLQISAHIPANAIKELDTIRNTGDSYSDLSFSTKKSLVETAAAKVNAYNKNTQQQFKHVESALQAAAAEKILAKSKVSTWLARVFNSNHSQKTVQEFLGTGSNSLVVLKTRWRQVKQQFDAVEKNRQTVGNSARFNFVPLETFLSWHYDARTAYIAEANARIEDTRLKQTSTLAQAQAEVDRNDFASALFILRSMQTSALTTSEKNRYTILERYAQTQLELEKTDDTEANDESTQADIEAMNSALEGLGSISQPYKSIIQKAIANKDYGAVITIMTVAENGSKYSEIKQSAELEAEREVQTDIKEQMESDKKVQTETTVQPLNLQVPKPGPKVASIVPLIAPKVTHDISEESLSATEDAAQELEKTTSQKVQERTQQKIQEVQLTADKTAESQNSLPEPRVKIMQLDAAGGGADAILTACTENKGNPEFLQNNIVRVAGVDKASHTSLATMNRKITAGLRAEQLSTAT